MVPDQTARIAALNDRLRKTFTGGQVLLTQGVSVLSPAAKFAILQKVREFAAFSAENDPCGQHDFGSFKQDGQTIYWKIDYYDAALEWGSPDPADPEVTTRVLTILLAEEY
jgi:Protein of unknown function (DUF3768)